MSYTKDQEYQDVQECCILIRIVSINDAGLKNEDNLSNEADQKMKTASKIFRTLPKMGPYPAV